ncbi:MAG: response regulator transcription factor [Hyphomicrobiales bacterium]
METQPLLAREYRSMHKRMYRKTGAETRFLTDPTDEGQPGAAPAALLSAAIPEETAAPACVLESLCRLIEPALARLRETGLSAEQLKWVETIEDGLRSGAAPLAERPPAHFLCLTPAELQIATLIRHRKSSRQIGELMRISPRTVEVHRNNIRKKLGLTRKSVNLRTHLLCLG